MYKLLLLSFFCSFVFSIVSHAQNAAPKSYEIKSDTAFETALDSSYLLVLEDKAPGRTIDEIRSTPFVGYKYGVGKTSNIIWFYYRLKNTMDTAVNIALDSRVNRSDFYVFGSTEKPAHFVTGHLYPRNKRDGFKEGNYIPIVLKPGEEISVYQRMEIDKSGLPKNFRVDFVNTEKAIQQEFEALNARRNDHYLFQHLLEAFVVGLLFLTVFFNLFFYRVVHEKINLYFGLFALFLGINRLYNILSEFFRWDFPTLVPYVKYIGYAWAFIIWFLIQFIREFFRTKQLYPKWDKWLIGLAIFNFSWNIVRLLFPLLPKGNYMQFFGQFGIMVLFFIIPLSILITISLFVRKKDTPTRLVIAGTAPLMLLYTSDISESFGIRVTGFLGSVINNFRIFEVIAIVWLILLFSWTLFMRYDNLKKENAQRALDNERLAREKEIQRTELIELQKAELEKQVAERTLELEASLTNLQSTQKQLIQSEKMASLGELTAGIAHEIQNPLNFVNNFSELNMELLTEMKIEIDKEDIAEIKALAGDIVANEAKINHHGKRADAIVKGMLQHSRQGKGEKTLTGINTLVDEYIRLCLHGMRTKNSAFNASIKTSFDQTAGELNIIAQDIGIVLQNILANAFYAVNEKNIQADKTGIPYEPTVSVSTKKTGNKISIAIGDNGNGIPEKIAGKIFQPFFTTKPTGEGTGLGLSISYDVVKAHNGEVTVETKQGEGTTFSIELPAG